MASALEVLHITHLVQLSPKGEVNSGGYTDTQSVEVYI